MASKPGKRRVRRVRRRCRNDLTLRAGLLLHPLKQSFLFSRDAGGSDPSPGVPESVL